MKYINRSDILSTRDHWAVANTQNITLCAHFVYMQHADLYQVATLEWYLQPYWSTCFYFQSCHVNKFLRNSENQFLKFLMWINTSLSKIFSLRAYCTIVYFFFSGQGIFFFRFWLAIFASLKKWLWFPQFLIYAFCFSFKITPVLLLLLTTKPTLLKQTVTLLRQNVSFLLSFLSTASGVNSSQWFSVHRINMRL